MLRVTILGTGTSSGVPVIGCSCPVCTSTNQKNNRLRSSVSIELLTSSPKKHQVLVIDTGPDFRVQALQSKLERLDGILYTHGHADHIFGLDDVRIFNFKQGNAIPIYAEQAVLTQLETCFPYAFSVDPSYEGGGIPHLEAKTIHAFAGFSCLDIPVMPIRLMHGQLPTLGFVIGNLAYCTDCSSIPDESREHIRNIDYLIISGLRDRPHKTHFTIDQAINVGLSLGVKNIVLTHIAHEIEHEQRSFEINKRYGNQVRLAYDGMVLELPNPSKP